jgi:cytochrome c oxidase subunit 2
MVMRKLFNGAGLAAAALLAATPAWAQDMLGQPVPGAAHLQEGGSPIYREAIWFHNVILMPIIVLICLFVLGLLITIVVKFNRKANPTPSRTTHNTALEVVWTVLPVLILMGISIFSFRLLYRYHDMPKPDVTVKVTGNQWYWSFEYPDHGDYGFDSRLLSEEEAKAKGQPYRLAVNNPMVVPAGRNVRLLITGADVIHAVGVPSLGLKTDAIPGRVNEAWFRAEKPGVYHGQCYELCGVDHAFMPLQITALPPAEFDAWIAANAPPPAPPAAAAAPAAAPAEATTAAPAEGAAPATPPAAPAPAAAPAAAG